RGAEIASQPTRGPMRLVASRCSRRAVVAALVLVGCPSSEPSTQVDRVAAARRAYLSGSTAIDLDGDGEPDWFRVASTPRGPTDTDEIHTRNADVVWLRTADRDRLEIDLNRDGVYEYDRDTERSADGQVTVLTEDSDGDFVPDRRIRITASSAS